MKTLGIILAGVLVLALLSTNAIIHFTTMEEVAFEVEHRERVIIDKNDTRYMVWANMGNRTEVFQNTDSILSLKFNSADLYGEMMPGRECVATVNGFRIPWASMNRNILTVACDR